MTWYANATADISSPAKTRSLTGEKNTFASWEEQVAICLPHLQVTRLVGGTEIPQQLAENPAIALITYSQLTYVTEYIFDYLQAAQTFMILDESHKIKGGEFGAWGKASTSRYETV